MEPIPRELLEYESESGKCPFKDWLESLRDIQARAIIRKRLNRVRLGNLGVNRSVGQGVWELKINFGPGYRIYYGEDGPKIVVLLCGGDKGTQSRDIEEAKAYWKDYLS